MTYTAVHMMGRAELAAKIALFEGEVRALKRIVVNCSVCVHGERPLACKKWGTVPQQVWANGCAEWLWDEIPF